MASSASRGNIKSRPSNLKVSERPLTLIKTIGEKGSGDGQFNNPTSLAVTTEGDIVVADRNNKRVQFLSKDGAFKKKVDLEFQPWCVAALPEDKKLLVTGNGPMLQVLDEQGMTSGVIQVTGAVEADETTEGIAVDSSGYIFVTIRNKVFMREPLFDSSFTFKLFSTDEGQLGSSLRVAVNKSDQIIVSDLENNNIKLFYVNKETYKGRLLFTCGSSGRKPGELDMPFCVITYGSIIVAEKGNDRVSMFSSNGTFSRILMDREEHGLDNPQGLAIQDRHVFVAGIDYVKIFKIRGGINMFSA